MRHQPTLVMQFIPLLLLLTVTLLASSSSWSPLGMMSSRPVEAAVIGIDFGSEFIKVALVKPGTGPHIVVDEMSKRKVPAVVAFCDGERHFGNGAMQLAIRKPKDTYMWAHRLLGKDESAPELAQLRELAYPWEIVTDPQRRSLAFRHHAAGSGEGEHDVLFSVEEIVAMSLQHIQKIAEADAEGGSVRDCVLTVPPHWTQRERAAILDAAELAGLNVLALTNENTAAAIQYGIERKYEGNGNDTHTALFYNMGSTSTKVTLADYSSWTRKERGGRNRTVGQVEVRGIAYDASLGGHAFEARISDWVTNEVNKQLESIKGASTTNIRTNMRAMAKVRAAAEKAKIVLSANQDTQVFLGSLIDDRDFKMTLTREEFYAFSTDLLDRVAQPAQQALEAAGRTIDQVDAVVIIGGGVRIPAVQAKLKEFSQRDYLAQNLNGDDAMAMGAVFRAANLSTAFQVRPFGVVDVTPYAVGVRLTDSLQQAHEEKPETTAEEGADASTGAAQSFHKRASLFKRFSPLHKKKTIQFKHSSDFLCHISHELQSNPLPPGIPAPIAAYNITGLSRLGESAKYAPLLTDQKPRVSISFQLDLSGLVSITRAEATLEEMVKVPKPKAKDTKTNETNTNATADANATQTEETKKAEDATEQTGEKAAEGSETNGEEEEEFIMKKKLHTIPLTVSKIGSPGSIERMNATQKLLSKATLEKLRLADELKKEIAAAKNTLEAHIYATRAQLSEEDVEAVSTEEQRETLRSALAEAEDWLYEQGDESASIFKDKLTSLRALSDPLFFRRAEREKLPIAIEMSRSLFQLARKKMAEYEREREWVPEASRQSVLDKVADVEAWLDEKVEAHTQTAPHEDPVLESEAVYMRLEPINKLLEEVSRIKKPIPKKKKKKSTNTTSTENKNNTTDGNTTESGSVNGEGRTTTGDADADSTAAQSTNAEQQTQTETQTQNEQVDAEQQQQQQQPETEQTSESTTKPQTDKKDEL